MSAPQVEANIIEVRKDEETIGRGKFLFAALPRTGETLTLGTEFGGIDVMKVRAVEHKPVILERKTRTAEMEKEEGALATIFVSRIATHSGQHDWCSSDGVD